MATDTGADPHVENARLRETVDELNNRLQKLESEREAVRRMGWFGLKLFVGGNLRRAFWKWMDAKWEPFPKNETADLAAALVRRVVRVSLVGLTVAVIPPILMALQIHELRKQTRVFQGEIAEQKKQHAELMDYQEQDRRRLLRATIFDCADASSGAGRQCEPRADLRAREEAVWRFVESELRQLRDYDGLPDLSYSVLRKAKLNSMDLRASFFGSDLREAELRKSNFRGADFTWAQLQEADFRFSDLEGARFENALLDGALVCGLDLSTTEGLQSAQLDRAVCDEGTVFRDGWSCPSPRSCNGSVVTK